MTAQPGHAGKGLGGKRLARRLAAWRRAMQADRPCLSEAASWRMLDMVYSQHDLLWANALLIVLSGTMVWFATRTPWPLIWTAAGLAVALLRLMDFYRFKAHRHSMRLSEAQRRFRAGAIAVGLVWGAASLEALADPGPAALMTLCTVQSAFVASTVARNNALKRTASIQVCVTLLPVCVAYSFAPFAPLHIIAALDILYAVSCLRAVDGLHRQSVRLILADEENATLLGAVRVANAKLQHSNALLESMASTDGLTGIANRRSFDAALVTEWRRAERDDTAIGLLLIDIDNFKGYNDTLGHQAGDDCLKQVASCIASEIRRPGDFAARYGGEEFAVILPRTDAFGAIDIGEHIRCSVHAMSLSHPGAGIGEVTISVGVASLLAGRLLPDSDEPPAREALIAMADAALYCAKRGGRNRVCGNGSLQAEAASG